jgi:RNA polymerase sigma-B factor
MSLHEEDSASTTRERSLVLFGQLTAGHSSATDRSRARGQLVELHLPLVEHCARRFVNRGEPFEDLLQVGTIGLIKAVDRFDSDRGVEFSTYATPTIIGEIKRHFRDKGWAVRVPRRLQELRMSIGSATGELSQQLGRSPTTQEVADRLGVGIEDVLEGIESANAYATLSLDAGDREDGLGSLIEMMGASDEALDHVELRESIRPLIEQLPPRERQILMLRFFRQMTQSQIAREVGISQMHVSRLLTRTLAELRDSIG